MELTVLKPINKIYSLQDGKVVINESAGKSFTNSERLFHRTLRWINYIYGEKQ